MFISFFFNLLRQTLPPCPTKGTLVYNAQIEWVEIQLKYLKTNEKTCSLLLSVSNCNPTIQFLLKGSDSKLKKNQKPRQRRKLWELYPISILLNQKQNFLQKFMKILILKSVNQILNRARFYPSTKGEGGKNKNNRRLRLSRKRRVADDGAKEKRKSRLCVFSRRCTRNVRGDTRRIKWRRLRV